MRKLNDVKTEYQITHQKRLIEAYGGPGEWMDAECIESQDVIQLYVDDKYLVVLCHSRGLHSLKPQRTVKTRCVETFQYVGIVSIPYAVNQRLATSEPHSSDYSNGLYVTEFPTDQSSKDSPLMIKYLHS